MRLAWISWVGPKYNHKCPCRKEAEGDLSQIGRRQSEDRAESFEDVMLLALKMEEGAKSQGMQGMQL